MEKLSGLASLSEQKRLTAVLSEKKDEELRKLCAFHPLESVRAVCKAILIERGTW